MSDINIEKFDAAQFEKEESGFSQLANIVIQNITDNLAFHIWAYLQSKPIGWIPNRQELMKHFRIANDKLAQTITFLKNSNLVTTSQERLPNGKMGEYKIRVLNGSKFIVLPSVNSRSRPTAPDLKIVDNTKTAPGLTAPPVNPPPVTAPPLSRPPGSPPPGLSGLYK